MIEKNGIITEQTEDEIIIRLKKSNLRCAFEYAPFNYFEDERSHKYIIKDKNQFFERFQQGILHYCNGFDGVESIIELLDNVFEEMLEEGHCSLKRIDL